MKISDLVTMRIMEMLEQGGTADIQRNELASMLGCVPSQINYVISSRFTPEQGYIVESRRGGGGYIRISRVNYDRSAVIMHVVNSLGRRLDYAAAVAIIKDLAYQRFIDVASANLMLAAMSEKVLYSAPVDVRDNIRSSVFKQMLLTAINE